MEQSILDIISAKFPIQQIIDTESCNAPFSNYNNVIGLYKHKYHNHYAFVREALLHKSEPKYYLVDFFQSDWKELQKIEQDHLNSSISFKIMEEHHAQVILSCLI